MLDLCTLGTGGTLPMPERALSSLMVRVNGKAVLIDCGEGTQTELRRLGWGFLCIDAVLLTHYHGDHCTGLTGFLLSVGKTGRTEPLEIYGPPGLKHVIAACRVIAPQLPFPLALHELPLEEAHFSAVGLEFTSFPLHHSVPCLGYRFELKRAPAFDVEKAKALDIPMLLWRFLQQGQAVTVGDRMIGPEAVQGAPRKGLSVLYATDTRPVPAIAHYGFRTDLMFVEGMYGDEDKRQQADANCHMLFAEAAALARDAETQQLVLTHFSTCIEDPEVYLPLAQAVFPNTVTAHDGMVFSLKFTAR